MNRVPRHPPATIKLGRPWRIGDPLHSGGFGEIFEARAQDGTEAVVKLIPKAPGASRELLFEELSGLPNIIPILDSGEWKGFYVLVMPRAQISLRQHLKQAGGKLPVDQTVQVLIDICQALVALKEGVVHRDLKPENVLLYQGHWCLADFGIARYAEATTEAETRKFAMTPAYAAPEQWRMERATSATDVYSFGVLAFELVQGHRPFPGPDFRQQHLTQVPPGVTGVPPSLSSLINECMFKAAKARPTPANILARLQATLKTSHSRASLKLHEVQRAVTEAQAKEAARISAEQSLEETRREIFEAAKGSFGQIVETLRQRALEAAPATKVSAHQPGALTLSLGKGVLEIDSLMRAPGGCLAAFDYDAPFDVIAYTAIEVRKPRDYSGYEGRSHSLWFCDAQEEGRYRWYELAFMVSPLVRQQFNLDPFALPPTDQDAGRALAPVLDIRQVAWQPVAFDQGAEEAFIERWLEWFAAAATGNLNHPTSMPEHSGGSFRSPRKQAN